MKALAALLLYVVTLAGTCDAQNCYGNAPIQQPPLGHPDAVQTCVCESMNRGCHWAWVDQPEPEHHPAPYVNQFDQAMREATAAKRREKELREERQFIEEQNDHVNDLEILKAVHDRVLVPLEPGEETTLPTIRNSSGQEFRVVPPASTPTLAHPTDSDHFTHGFFNGRMWITMSESDRTSYVSGYLRDFAHSCFHTANNARELKACYAKLGNPDHPSPERPQEIVDGVNDVFSVPENGCLTIPVAIKAASMKASGQPQDGIDKFLQTERSAVAGPSKP